MSKFDLSAGSMVANRITVIGATLLGLGAAVYLGMAAGHQETTKIWLFFVAMAGIVIALILGDKYWLLLPFSMGLDVSALPSMGGRDVQLLEMAAVGCTGLFIMRMAMKRERLELLRGEYLPVVIFFIWVVFTYFRNPIGLSIFGSTGVVGARDYMKIGLAFCAFIVLANQRASAKDVKWLLIIAAVTPFINLASAMLKPDAGVDINDPAAEAYGWQQFLSAPANMVFVLIFSRFTVAQVFSFSRPYLVPLLLVALGLAMFSGKRAIAFLALGTPAITSLIRGRIAPAVLCALALVLFVTFLVLGHGTWFQLPWSTQRVLMNLPGNWDPDLKNYAEEGGDGFRAQLREIAWEKIRGNPILGRGIGIQMDEVLSATANVKNMSNPYFYAQGSSWHSLWLGLMVDFGILAAIPFVFVFGMILKLCWQIYKSHPPSNVVAVYGMFSLVMTIQGIMRSYTSGNATGATMWWLTLGLLLAVRDGVARKPAATPVPQPQRHPSLRERIPLEGSPVK